MGHAHVQRNQHRFVSIDSPNGRCTEQIRHSRGTIRCGMLPGDPSHRYYPCRKGCAGLDFRSCEARDRHEANVHGNGW